MADQAITLASVENFIREGRKGLGFPTWLEAQFERDTRDRRSKFLRTFTLRTILVYNFFLIGDWLLAPDTFFLAVALHFLVVTPWILFVAWLTRGTLAKTVRELAAASIPAALVLQILTIYCLTTSIYAAHYVYFVLATGIYSNSIQRLRYVYAVSVSACLLAMAAAAIVGAGKMPTPVAVMQGVNFVTCAYITLILNFTLDRDVRRSYLHALRDRLRLVEIDAEAKHDALTDLANRHYLTARAADIWRDGDDKSSPVAALLLDIDHFKTFNDLYGHPAGDACLKRVAASVTAELRNGEDLAVRYGGEELLVLLPRTEIADAVRIAERIRRAIAALGIPHDGAGQTGMVTASFGVSAAPVSALSLAELISAADIALYTAKRNGRNQVCPPLLRDYRASVPDDPAVTMSTRARRGNASDPG